MIPMIRRNGGFLVFFLVYHARVSSFRVVPRPRTASLKTLRLSVASLVEEETASRDRANEARQVVIVGGGVGGLAMAARLAAAAVQVTLLEKNDFTGGRCGSFPVDITDPQNDRAIVRVRHERGPSLLLLPHLYEQLYQDVAHTTAAAYGLTMRPCVPAYTVVFEDGDRISVGFPDSVMKNDDDDALQRCYQESRQIMNRWEEQGAEKWDDYLDICRSYLQCGLPNFIEERLDLSTLPSFIEAATRNGFQAWPLKPHSDVLDDLFQSDKMRALASFQDLYVGLEPYRNDRFPGGGVGHTTAPAVFGLLSAIELHPECGVFAPVGGFQSVQESLHRLAVGSGVQIRCNTTVVRVTEEGVYYHDTKDAEGGEPNAVTHSPKLMPADIIVVNADLPYAQQSLLEKANTEAKYDWDDEHYRYSSGVIAFHWSMNRSLDELNTHTVFLCAANRTVAQQSWESVRSLNVTGTSFMTLGNDEPFNFYVHRASKTDPTAAPKGMDAIMVLVPCPTLQRNATYANLPRTPAISNYKSEQFPDEVIDRVRSAVLHRLSVLPSLSHLQRSILHEVVDTPATYAEQYNVAAGTPFGLSHGLQQLSVLRPPRRMFATSKKEPSNVVYCGASTRPGNGVPLVLTSAKLVAEQVLRTLNAQRS